LIATVLMVASAGILLALGALHLLFTFSGPKLTPRDPDLRAAMERTTPLISKETTMWRAWIGFNASHSMGAMLFGLVYGYLALSHGALLFHSSFLLGVGLAMVGGFFVLGKVYWFSVPFAGISLSLACYLGAVAVSLIS